MERGKQGKRAHLSEIDIIGGVMALYSRIHDQLSELSVEHALSRPERSVIINLRQPRRLGWLAQELQLVPSAMTVIADGLTQKGLVIRENDPEDRRAMQLRLTKEGYDILNEFELAASRIVREAAGFTDAQVTELAVLMRKVLQS